MNRHNTRGWIIRCVNTSDGCIDNLLYTKDFGKIYLKIPGASKAASKLACAHGIFKEIEFAFVMAEGACKGRLISSKELKSFELVEKVFQRYVEISVLCELADALTPVCMPNQEKYELFGRCMSWIGEEENFDFAKSYFLINYLKVSGHSLQFGKCLNCGKTPDFNVFYLTGGGIICGSCRAIEKYHIKIDNNTLNMLIDFSASGIPVINRNIICYDKTAIERVFDFLISHYAGRKLKTDMFKSKII